MSDEFRKIHIIQVALQQKGAPPGAIQDMLAKFESMAKSPEDFEKWNEELDEKGIQVMTMMLQPGGEDLCDTALQTMFDAIVTHYGITQAELEEAFRWN